MSVWFSVFHSFFIILLSVFLLIVLRGELRSWGLGIDVCSTCTSEMLVVVFPFLFFHFLFQTRLRQNQNQRQHEATSFTTISYLDIIENRLEKQNYENFETKKTSLVASVIFLMIKFSTPIGTVLTKFSRNCFQKKFCWIWKNSSILKNLNAFVHLCKRQFTMCNDE